LFDGCKDNRKGGGKKRKKKRRSCIQDMGLDPNTIDPYLFSVAGGTREREKRREKRGGKKGRKKR